MVDRCIVSRWLRVKQGVKILPWVKGDHLGQSTASRTYYVIGQVFHKDNLLVYVLHITLS